MKFFSKRWSSTPIGRPFLNNAEYIHRSRWSQKFSEAPRQFTRLFASPGFCGDFLKPLRKSLPIRAWPQGLHDFNLGGIRADENAGFVALHAAKNARRGFFGRSAEEPIKLGGFFL